MSAGSIDALGVFGGLLYVIRQHQGRRTRSPTCFSTPSEKPRRSHPCVRLFQRCLPKSGRLDEVLQGRLASEAMNGFDIALDSEWLIGMHSFLDATASVADRAAKLSSSSSRPTPDRSWSLSAVSLKRGTSWPLGRVVSAGASTAKPRNGSRPRTTSTNDFKRRSGPRWTARPRGPLPDPPLRRRPRTRPASRDDRWGHGGRVRLRLDPPDAADSLLASL